VIAPKLGVARWLSSCVGEQKIAHPAGYRVRASQICDAAEDHAYPKQLAVEHDCRLLRAALPLDKQDQSFSEHVAGFVRDAFAGNVGHLQRSTLFRKKAGKESSGERPPSLPAQQWDCGSIAHWGATPHIKGCTVLRLG
jgi:hypothetical protein